jgi:hypothetical protein
VIGEYVYDGEGGRHQAFYSPTRDVQFKDVHFKAGERIQVEQSLKYSAEEANLLWKASELNEVGRWSASSESYSKCSLDSQICLFEPQITPSNSVENIEALFPASAPGKLRCWSHDHLTLDNVGVLGRCGV